MLASKGPLAAAIGSLATLLCVSAANAQVRATSASTNRDPYAAAARSAGVPVEVLVAVAGAESGFHPLALDVGGREIYCRSRAEAERILATTDNVDIGLMQIHWPFWGRRLGVSKYELLDPHANLYFGAHILKQALMRQGNFWSRLSDYHSGSRQSRARYNRKVYEVYLAYMHGQIR